MRIGEVNLQNYQSLLRAFWRLGGNKTGKASPFAATRSRQAAFDPDNMVNSHGISGMCITGKDPSSWHKIVPVSEQGRQSMFDMVKREFIQENGVANGDTTKRSDVFAAYQRSIPREDRLSATWTLGQYERAYTKACFEAVRASDPNWQIGQSFDARILDSVTRESVEARLVQTGPDSLSLSQIDCLI